ncbi:MAG TPA: hypothetical protein O0X70_03380 [Methanocorpusculum sp.]|nr:hypothetical protein [Methanocorpusculum sp.]
MQLLHVILLILLACAIFAGIFAFVLHIHGDETEPVSAGGLERWTYTLSGDMLGGYYSLELRVADGAVKISEEAQETHNSERKQRTASGDAELVSQIEEIIKKNKMYTWKNLKKSDVFALDAAAASYSFTYSGERISFSEYDILPEGGDAAVGEINRLIKSCLS